MMIEQAIERQLPTTHDKLHPRWLIQGAVLILTLVIPILLPLLAVRLVMTPLFLQIEYQRPGFPEDFYGFSTEDRLYYAPYALNYLLNDADITYLADLTFADGNPLYVESELRHMEDVKVVTRAAFFVLLFGSMLLIGITVWMIRQSTLRPHFWQGLLNGGLLTIGILVTIVLGAVFAWDFFFTTFHQLFFQDGTWIFLYSDTLIRLFPEQFWFDAALTIGGLSVGGALVCIALAWRQLSVGKGSRTGNGADKIQKTEA